MFFADQNHLSQCFFCKLLIKFVTLVAHSTTMTGFNILMLSKVAVHNNNLAIVATRIDSH